jgi:Tol biopolymer transport system component
LTLIPGTLLGPYEITAAIGAGGMGEVYRARDSRLGRDVAIKVLPESLAHDAGRRERFEREARAVAALSHPNIINIYDTGLHDGHPFVVMELLDGETLRDRLTSGPFPVRKAVEIAVQIARGLGAAHDKQIVHRDLKPENIFIIRDGQVKILDFGLAREIATSTSGPAETRAAMTDPGIAMGTVGYMAPEQIRAQTVDGRTDLFAFGAVLFEMLRGTRAFQRDTAAETMTAILKEDVPDLGGMNVQIPLSLDRIVRHCLEKNPAERFQSARDVAFALEAFSGTNGGSAANATVTAASSPGGGTLRLVLAVAGAIALAAGGYLVGHRGVNAESTVRFHQLAFRHGLIGSALFANDGKTIVYAAAWDGKPYELFSTQESSPESRALGLPESQPLAISRNSEMLVLRRGTLARVPVSGGAPRDVAEGVRSADWAPDGASIAVVRAGGVGEVVEFPVGKKIYETPGNIRAMRVEPGGGLIVVADAPLTGDSSARLVVMDADGRVKTTSDLWSAIDGVSWSAAGSEIWFAGSHSADEGFSLYGMDLTGRTRLLHAMPLRWRLADVAGDGRVLLSSAASTAALWFRAAGAATETDLYWHDHSDGRDIAPDLQHVLFSEGGAADNQTDFRTYVRGTDGSPAVEIGEGLGMAFSPDGQWVMTDLNAQPSQLVAYPVHAGQSRVLTSDAIRHLSGRWLPDGQRIVFVGIEPGKGARYYVQDTSQSRPRAIADVAAAFERDSDPIVLSPDGLSVAAPVGEGIQILPLDGGASRKVPGAAAGTAPLAWCRDGSLLFYKRNEIPAKVMRLNLESGASTLWREIAPVERTGLVRIQSIRVAADCQTYLYSPWVQADTLLVMRGVRPWR